MSRDGMTTVMVSNEMARRLILARHRNEFCVSTGMVIVEFPDKLSSDDMADVRDLFRILLGVMERCVIKDEPSDGGER